MIYFGFPEFYNTISETLMKMAYLNPCKSSSHHFLIPLPSFLPAKTHPNIFSSVSCKNPISPKSLHNQNGSSRNRIKLRGKDNVWSVDNEVVGDETKRSKNKNGRGKKENPVTRKKKKKKSDNGDDDGRIIVSAAMLVEVETVLQTQEPVIRPEWNTFSSSVSGIWRGVGAVFSPITAEMEPVDVGSKNDYLYDCYTLSRIEAVSSEASNQTSLVQRKTNWVTFNPGGEIQIPNKGSNIREEEQNRCSTSVLMQDNRSVGDRVWPKYESFNFKAADVMEEDFMGMEPGLVFFEDGSYSRGPDEIPVGKVAEPHISLTFKFEQCLVKGCHKRLRIIHTIEFNDGGSDIQIMRVAVNEEQWASPANLPDENNPEFDVKPFSQRKRIQPSDLTGSWKVFEVSATPIYGDDDETEDINFTPYVYLCTETLKKRNLPENSVSFGEEEILDMQDATVLWLPGGVTAYVDVSNDGILCIGVGWYSDEGINLVMERDYGMDGKLKEVRSKSEIKRRWYDPHSG